MAARWLVVVFSIALLAASAYVALIRTEVTSHTDSTGNFSFSYPEGWTVQPYEWIPCCHGDVPPEPDWTTQTQPITLYNDEFGHDTEVSIIGGADSAFNNSVPLSDIELDQFNTLEDVTINGYHARYGVTDFVGPAEVEAYKDHTYTISDGDYGVQMYFRERYRHDWNEYNFDASELLRDFEYMVNSIKFHD